MDFRDPFEPAGRDESRSITDITRRDITDWIATAQLNWAGRLDEPGFIKRVFPDLDSMPSNDFRFRSATADIRQHRENNYDWPDDWVFDDERFQIRTGSDELFVGFLSQMVHPAVRPDREEAMEIVAKLNELLKPDGWEIAEISQLSGRPVYAGRQIEAYRSPTESLDLDRFDRLDDPQVLRDHLKRIERDMGSDPPGAIGASKELVESVCKLILEDYEEPWDKSDDVMDLYKGVQKVLQLNAEAVPESTRGSKAAVKALRAMVTTIQSLTEMRNAMGLGHGSTSSSPALTRHARLAFNTAIALTEFLLETWDARKQVDG